MTWSFAYHGNFNCFLQTRFIRYALASPRGAHLHNQNSQFER